MVDRQSKNKQQTIWDVIRCMSAGFMNTHCVRFNRPTTDTFANILLCLQVTHRNQRAHVTLETCSDALSIIHLYMFRCCYSLAHSTHNRYCSSNIHVCSRWRHHRWFRNISSVLKWHTLAHCTKPKPIDLCDTTIRVYGTHWSVKRVWS